MSCKKCLKYGHTVNRCRETIATCARCSNQVHNNDKCTIYEVKCYHCEADHQTFSRNCPKFNRETELNLIQIRERIPRAQAIQKLLRLNPNLQLIFSNAVKNTCNLNRSKSRLILNKKANPTQVVRTQARVTQEFVESRSKFTKNWGEKDRL